MSKIKKSELLDIVREQGSVITNLLQRVTLLEKPQLKQLDQSIFDGLDEKWMFAAVDADGDVHVYDGNPTLGDYEWVTRFDAKFLFRDKKYDASNWQNSLIERSTAKELTGSELCKAMLARGDKYVLCIVSPSMDAIDNSSVILPKVVTTFHEYGFITTDGKWAYAIPINNQGEPLTAAEVGL